MSLAEYKRKRDFTKTAEPKGRGPGRRTGHRFVVQKHDATRLHYDFRLEIGGTLKSWAVPRGIPLKHGEKRLAVHVEDHPVSYIDFEGIIPRGQYGGGTVMVWDRGTFSPESKTPAKDLAGGKLHFSLHGDKLHGQWYLVQLRHSEEWLLIRGGDDMGRILPKSEDTSALSGKSMKELSSGDRMWTSKRKGRKSPLPSFIEPMKAELVAHPPSGDWTYEIKFDGFRALALRGSDETRLLSRNEKDLGSKFPDIMAAIAALKVGDAIIDGEIVVLDPEGRSSFQLLQAYELGQEHPPLFFYAFDLLRLDGEDLCRLPLSERKAQLEKLCARTKSDVLRFSGSLGADGPALLKEAGRLGLEGLIGKAVDSVYEAGRRSGAWVKLKLVREQEFVIGGYTPPEGARSHFGALLLGVQSKDGLHFVGKVGTGFDAALLRDLHRRFKKISSDSCPFQNLPEKRRPRYGRGLTPAEMRRCHWLQPELVCQVKFSEWTRDDRLRQPVFLGLREDRDAADVVREKPV